MDTIGVLTRQAAKKEKVELDDDDIAHKEKLVRLIMSNETLAEGEFRDDRRAPRAGSDKTEEGSCRAQGSPREGYVISPPFPRCAQHVRGAGMVNSRSYGRLLLVADHIVAGRGHPGQELTASCRQGSHGRHRYQEVSIDASRLRIGSRGPRGEACELTFIRSGKK